jgi:hypothetical protein
MKINYFLKKIMMITMILIINNYLIIKINYSIVNGICIILFFFDQYMTYFEYKIFVLMQIG